MHEMADSDERLMNAFSQGNAEAFNELFRRYQQPIFGFFKRRLRKRPKPKNWLRTPSWR
jgi:hypothetical protein